MLKTFTYLYLSVIVCRVEEEKTVRDMSVYQLLSFYVKKWYWILLLTIVGAGIGFIYSTYIQQPLYKSDATLLLVSSEDKKAASGSTLINNYLALFKSRRVLEPVIAQQHNSISYEELVASTTATNDKNTEVIKISIGTKDPVLSKALVDGVVVSFKNEVKKLYKLENVTVVDNASESTRPYNVNKVMQIALPATIGLLGSFIILFFIYDTNFSRKKKPSIKKSVTRTTPTKPKVITKPDIKSKKNTAINTTAKSSKAKPIETEVKPPTKKRATKSARTTSRIITKKQKK